jgi:hypothetical protein
VSDAYLHATMTTRKGILGRLLFEVFPNNPDDPNTSGMRNLKTSLDRALDHRASDVMRPSARTNAIRRANVSGHAPVFLFCLELSFKHRARPSRQIGRRLVSAVPNTVTRGERT